MWLTWRINPTVGTKEPIQRSSCSGSTTCELSLPTQATCCSQVLVDLHLVPLAADACVILGDARIQFWWIPALSVDYLLDWDIFRNLTSFLGLKTYKDQFLGLVQATNVLLVMLVVYCSDFWIWTHQIFRWQNVLDFTRRSWYIIIIIYVYVYAYKQSPRFSQVKCLITYATLHPRI